MQHVAARTEVAKAVRRAGLEWADLVERASEIVLFGSRAAGVATTASDWDLLLVGEGSSCHTHELDMPCVSPDMLDSERWLGSELANHIAEYGVWLHGSGAWRDSVFRSATATARKQEALRLQLDRLERAWADLLPGARTRHVDRLGREMQRLHLLRAGEAVPPTALLDAVCMQTAFDGSTRAARGSAPAGRARPFEGRRRP